MHFQYVNPEALVLGRRDSRGVQSFAPVYRVQVPAARCKVEARPGYYSVAIHFDRNRPAHEEFMATVWALEDAISAQDPESMPPMGTCRLVKDDGRMYLSARDDTEWFCATGENIRGSIASFPTDFRGASLLVEICKAWTGKDGSWGLRVKCLQAKEADPTRLRPPQSLFIEEFDEPIPLFVETD